MIITEKISYDSFNTVLNLCDFFINDELGNKICPFTDIQYVKTLREKFLSFSMLYFEDVDSENEVVKIKFTNDELSCFYFIEGFAFGYSNADINILDFKTDYIEVLKDKYKDYMYKREEKLKKEGK